MLKFTVYLSQQGQRLFSTPLASRTVRIRLRCFSFQVGTLLNVGWSKDFLTRGDDGTFCWGDSGLTLGTSGRSSSLCLAESNTLRFLVPTFWQTFLCLSSDSTLNVLKHIGQGSRICSSTSLTTSGSAARTGAGGGGSWGGALDVSAATKMKERCAIF